MAVCRVESSNLGKMENLSNSDENYDLGCQPSLSFVDQNDQSIPETPGYSTLTGESFVYGGTCSETSAFSDPIDDHSCCSEASPSHWPPTRSIAQNQAVLRRLGTKQRGSNEDEKQLDCLESLELGQISGRIIYTFTFSFFEC